MIGSDLPESLETEMSKILGLAIADSARRDILWNTARRLFDPE
jgi:predicted TIM-barrel fold metal-dependent hydrolase